MEPWKMHPSRSKTPGISAISAMWHIALLSRHWFFPSLIPKASELECESCSFSSQSSLQTHLSPFFKVGLHILFYVTVDNLHTLLWLFQLLHKKGDWNIRKTINTWFSLQETTVITKPMPAHVLSIPLRLPWSKQHKFITISQFKPALIHKTQRYSQWPTIPSSYFALLVRSHANSGKWEVSLSLKKIAAQGQWSMLTAFKMAESVLQSRSNASSPSLVGRWQFRMLSWGTYFTNPDLTQ